MRDTAGVSAPSGHAMLEPQSVTKSLKTLSKSSAEPRALASTSCWLGVSSASASGRTAESRTMSPTLLVKKSA